MTKTMTALRSEWHDAEAAAEAAKDRDVAKNEAARVARVAYFAAVEAQIAEERRESVHAFADEGGFSGTATT